MTFHDEQLRVLANLSTAYDSWLMGARLRAQYPHRLVWKTVSGADYLYEVLDGSGNARSMGRRSEATETLFAESDTARSSAKGRISGAETRMAQLWPIYRGLKLPLISEDAGDVLRQADVDGFLGRALVVVGTNTMPAYELEARERFATGLDATQDCDLAWMGDASIAMSISGEIKEPILALLKRVNSSYTVNSERPFQVLNNKAYEVEILLAPSLVSAYPAKEKIRPTPLPEQEWLLLGQRVEQVVFDRSAQPAKIIAPDPRWMALHKLWLADKPRRRLDKKEKDRNQGLALLNAIRCAMPHYPIDESFCESVPAELRRYL